MWRRGRQVLSSHARWSRAHVEPRSLEPRSRRAALVGAALLGRRGRQRMSSRVRPSRAHVEPCSRGVVLRRSRTHVEPSSGEPPQCTRSCRCGPRSCGAAVGSCCRAACAGAALARAWSSAGGGPFPGSCGSPERFTPAPVWPGAYGGNHHQRSLCSGRAGLVGAALVRAMLTWSRAQGVPGSC